MTDEAIPVTVEILDKEYIVSCLEDERDALLESARLLNDRLRQVRDAGKVLRHRAHGSDHRAQLDERAEPAPTHY